MSPAPSIRQPLPKCDCLNWCGDDPHVSKAKAEYCDHHKEREKTAALVEMICWMLPDESMPEDYVAVLGFFDDKAENGPVRECSYLARKNQWYDAEGFETVAPKAWAKKPFGPRNTPWMTVRTVAHGGSV